MTTDAAAPGLEIRRSPDGTYTITPGPGQEDDRTWTAGNETQARQIARAIARERDQYLLSSRLTLILARPLAIPLPGDQDTAETLALTARRILSTPLSLAAPARPVTGPYGTLYLATSLVARHRDGSTAQHRYPSGLRIWISDQAIAAVIPAQHPTIPDKIGVIPY